jgi:hypothetical protein
MQNISFIRIPLRETVVHTLNQRRIMALTNEKRWPRGMKPLQSDAMEEKAPAATPLAAWPTSSAANFSRLSQEPGVKMVPNGSSSWPLHWKVVVTSSVALLFGQILTPKAYYATYDTMPLSHQGWHCLRLAC